MTNDSGQSERAKKVGWLMEPPGAGQTDFHIEITESAKPSAKVLAALNTVIAELFEEPSAGRSVERAALICGELSDCTPPYRCGALGRCQPLFKEPCFVNVGCRIAD
jgi:hypothetical protein